MLSAWLYGTSVHYFVAVAIALAYVLSVAPSRLSLRGPLVLASTIANRKSKTQAGQRMIPLNDDAPGAIRALYRRASAIDGTRLDHYPWLRKSNLTATLESVHLDEKPAIRTYVPPVPTSNCRGTGISVTCAVYQILIGGKLPTTRPCMALVRAGLLDTWICLLQLG